MVDAAEIRIWGELAGAVRWDDLQKMGYFQYAPSFLDKNQDLSPIKMPISQGSRIYHFPDLRKRNSENTFNGLPGLLSDSLPDKYGNKLINMWLSRQGRAENSMNPVEKLCFIGTRGMGALEFEPAQIRTRSESSALELDSLVGVARKILNERNSFLGNLKRDEERTLRDILKIGTSAGGARPKAVIAYDPISGDIRSGQGNIAETYQHCLLKLDGVSGDQFGESSGWGRVEYAYYLMATDCSITMSECRLLEENGRAHFMTKRFDREGGNKYHIQSLCGLQHYDFNDMQGYSYEQLFQTMRLLRLSYPEAEQMFRRMVFNVIACNYDDHTKNFSFILKKDQAWKLAPAYDLCFSFDPNNHWVNQQTLSINGKRQNITKKDLMSIAKDNNIKKGRMIIEEIIYTVSQWKDYAQKAEVRDDLSAMIQKKISSTSKQLNDLTIPKP